MLLLFGLLFFYFLTLPPKTVTLGVSQKNIEVVTIGSGSRGIVKEIYGEEAVKIAKSFDGVKLTRYKSARNASGFSFTVSFFYEDGTSEGFIVNTTESFVYRNYFYKAENYTEEQRRLLSDLFE